MPLPVTISGTAFPDQNYFCGPFKSSAGNFYVILLDSTDKSLIEAWKATDPTSSFTEQDSVDKPNLVTVLNSVWVYQVSDVLHIISSSSGASGVDELSYHQFNMATDNWDLVTEIVEASLAGGSEVDISCSIAVRSTADVIVLYNGDTDVIKGTVYRRVKYARREAGIWTVGIAVDNGGATNWFGSVIVPGSSDRMHFFFYDSTSFDAYQRTLNSVNSLEAFPGSFDALAGSGAIHHFNPGVHWTSGANEKVRCPYLDSTSKLSVAALNSADAPTVSIVATNISDNTVEDSVPSADLYPTACMALETDKQHILYSDDATQDLFRDVTGADNDTWGTDVEVLDAVTINRVSASVYTRGGATELAYVYDDAGTVKYNEVELVAAGPGSPYYVRTGGVPHMRIGRPGTFAGRTWD